MAARAGTASPRVPESAGAPFGAAELVKSHELDLGNAAEHELGYAITAPHHVIIVAEIVQDDSHFTPEIAVYRPGAVQDADAVVEREPASRSYLGLVAVRYRDLEPGGDADDLTGLDEYDVAACGMQIESARSDGHTDEWGQSLVVLEVLDSYFDHANPTFLIR